MAENPDFRERVTKQGEEALGKLAQDVLSNPLVNSAIARAFEAREKATQAQEVAFGALNIPSAADLERLTRRVRSVSQRLEGIEDGVDRLDETLGQAQRLHRDRAAPRRDRAGPRQDRQGAQGGPQGAAGRARGRRPQPGVAEGRRLLARGGRLGTARLPPGGLHRPGREARGGHDERSASTRRASATPPSGSGSPKTTRPEAIVQRFAAALVTAITATARRAGASARDDQPDEREDEDRERQRGEEHQQPASASPPEAALIVTSEAPHCRPAAAARACPRGGPAAATRRP